ncbi:MAG: hypothetical protein JNM72_09545 [Deltaproteobacteria bacterium]|nr:hypothetical protein [Deltaproteobacteria bacterium]
MLHLLVHNVGHHDVYLIADADGAPQIRRPRGGGLRALGERLAPQVGDATYAAPACLRLAAPLLRPDGESDDGGAITLLHMPLLGAALDAVEAQLQPPDRLLVLLLTAGKPRENNSPEALSATLRRMCAARWATLGLDARAELRHVHLPDAFALDPSALYERVQRPIEAEAVAIAKEHAGLWHKHLRVTLSASTGTAAMLAGLVTALHRWQPQILTVPNARQEPALDAQGRPVPFGCRTTHMHDVGASVPLKVDQLDDVGKAALQALRAWVVDYTAQRPLRAREAKGEAAFWFRKGQKEVLAAIITREPDGSLRAHRGVNLEVSLPTGSLCAERNAIGSAFVARPTLNRADIEAVAIVGLDGQDRLGPCGACQEWLRKVSEVNPGLQILTFDGPALTQVYHQPLSPS